MFWSCFDSSTKTFWHPLQWIIMLVGSSFLSKLRYMTYTKISERNSLRCVYVFSQMKMGGNFHFNIPNALLILSFWRARLDSWNSYWIAVLPISYVQTFYNKCCANSLLNLKQPKLWDLVCKVIIAAKLAQMTSNSLQVHRNLCTNAWKSQPQNTFRISSHMRISVDIPFERIKTQSNVSDFWSGYASQKDEYF